LADYEPVRDILTGTGTTDDDARSHLSLSAAKLVLKTTWAEAATALSADPDKATRNANAVTTRRTTAGRLDDVHHHVAEWVQHQGALAPATHTDHRALRKGHTNHLTVTRTEAKRVLAGASLQVTTTGDAASPSAGTMKFSNPSPSGQAGIGVRTLSLPGSLPTIRSAPADHSWRLCRP
jgi:hypothetical protein